MPTSESALTSAQRSGMFRTCVVWYNCIHMNRRDFLKFASAAPFAAGTAAALALRDGTTPRALDASKLIATLRAQKAFLG